MPFFRLEPWFFLAIFSVVGLVFAVMAVALHSEGSDALRRAAGEAPRWPLAREPWPFSIAPPARIRLAPVDDDSVAWWDAATVEAQSRHLRELGFIDAGTFVVEDLDGLCLRGFVKPEEGLRAVVGEPAEHNNFVEMFARHEDGRAFVLTNRSRGGDLAHPPGWIVQRHPGFDPSGLYQTMREVRPAGVPEVVDAAGFAADYERGYGELRDWRNLRGGFDEREVRSLAEEAGIEPSDDWVALALENEAHRAAMGLSEAAFHRFFAEAELDDLARYRLSRRIVIVHDRLRIEAVAEVFRLTLAEADWKIVGATRSGLHDDELDRPAPLAMWPPRRAFVALNDLLPSRRRFRKVGEVAEPIATDLYAPPGI